jgi:hypothetical protein
MKWFLNSMRKWPPRAQTTTLVSGGKEIKRFWSYQLYLEAFEQPL